MLIILIFKVILSLFVSYCSLVSFNDAKLYLSYVYSFVKTENAELFQLFEVVSSYIISTNNLIILSALSL